MIPRVSLVKNAGIRIGFLNFMGELPGNAEFYDRIPNAGSNDRSTLLRALPA
jgi:hypothetical protein